MQAVQVRNAGALELVAMIETVPLAQPPQAYAKMLKGDARFRMVITI